MNNKSRLNFLLSSFGRLKRSSAGYRTQQHLEGGNRAVPNVWQRSSVVRTPLKPNSAAVASCVRNLHFARRHVGVKQGEKVCIDEESDLEKIGGDVEDGRSEWGYEFYDMYNYTGFEDNYEWFDKNQPGIGYRLDDPRRALGNICGDDIECHLKEMGIDKLHHYQSWYYWCDWEESQNFRLIARNGYGKTLLYSIIFVHKLLRTASSSPGRPPQLLILVPHTEVAWEVLDMVELVTNKMLSVTCVHDGVLRQAQESKISAGVDILIGVPDHVENLVGNGVLSLRDLRHVVYDGFSCRMEPRPLEHLLNCDQNGTEQRKIQRVTVLSDAEDTSSKFEISYIGCVPDMNFLTNYAIQYQPSGLDAIIANLLQLHVGQVIIFADAKEVVDRLVLNRFIGEQLAVLYSDTPHDRMQKILKDFEDGRLKCLVSTEESPHIADYPSVGLVIQLGARTKIHTTCFYRFNLAATGSSVFLYQPSELHEVTDSLHNIMNEQENFRSWKITKEKQPEIVSATTKTSSRSLSAVSESSGKHFAEVARGLIAQHGPVSAVSSALAVIVDHVKKQSQCV